MKARVVTAITIHARPNDVFRYLINLQYHHLWNPHLQGTQPPLELHLGSRYHTTSLLFAVRVQSDITVVALTPDKELELQNDAGPLQYDIRYRLTKEQDTTILKCSTTVSSESNAFAFARPLLKLLAQRELQTDLQLLKIAVEENLQ